MGHRSDRNAPSVAVLVSSGYEHVRTEIDGRGPLAYYCSVDAEI